VNFAKMHGAGNDFLLFDGRAEPSLADVLPPLVPRLCNRRFGLGADGVLLLLPEGGAAATLVYWNADGSAAAFCANGTRCAARFASERWGWRAMVLRTGYADVPAEVAEERVTLSLPAPTGVRPWLELSAAGAAVRARFMVVGVPQLVVRVDWPDFWQRPLEPVAPALRAHAELREGGANVNFLQVGDGELAVRSWERGVEGETLSCGSGDVAAARVALAERWANAPARVRTASGRVLVVEPEGTPPSCPVRLSGPAEWVAEGAVRPELLR
jgi:diaminopimelate epimerase